MVRGNGLKNRFNIRQFIKHTEEKQKGSSAGPYTAFISYCHKPLDIAVAEHLHRMIERYRVPKALRRGNAVRMGKVFRDKEELTLSSDLTAELHGALDNAEFLIVVCTPDTPASPWVDMEIEYFLKRHDRDRVLAVLAAGTADNAFPRRLKEVYGEDGVTVIRQVEPLAANISRDANNGNRLSHFFSKRSWAWLGLHREFLRLAAALLGCSYDALRQRQKQYRQKQALAGAALITAIALGFSGTLITKNRMISDQNKQILEQMNQITAQNEEIESQMRQIQSNESYALSLVSAQQLQDGDRIGAVKSALAALPGEDNDRPYRTEAEKALADALYSYQGEKLQFACRIELETDVEQMLLSPDGDVLILQDENYFLYAYDTISGELLWKSSDKVFCFNQLAVLEGKNMLLCADMDSVTLMHLIVGGKVQEYTLKMKEENYEYVDTMVLLPNQTEIAVLYESKQQDSFCLRFCNALNGDVRCEVFLECPFIGEYCKEEIFFSQDGAYWAVCVNDNDFETNINNIKIFVGDTDTGEVIKCLDFEVDALNSFSCSFDEGNGMLVVCYEYKSYLQVERYKLDQAEPIYTNFNPAPEWNDTGADLLADYTYPVWWLYGREIYYFASGSGKMDKACVLPSECIGYLHAGKEEVFLVRRDGVVNLLDTPYLDMFEEPTQLGSFGFEIFKAMFADGGSGAVCAVPQEKRNSVVVMRPQQDDSADELALPSGIEYKAGAGCHYLPSGLVSLPGNTYSMLPVVLYDFKEPDDQRLASHRLSYSNNYIYSVLTGTSQDGRLLLIDDVVLDVENEQYWPLASTLPKEWQENYFIYQASSELISGKASYTVWMDLVDDQIFWWKGMEKANALQVPEENSVNFDKQFLAVGNNGWIVLSTDEGYSRSKLCFFMAYSTEQEMWHCIPNPDANKAWGVTCVADDHPWFAAAGGDGFCRIIDAETETVLQEYPLESGVDSVAELRFVNEDKLLALRYSNYKLQLLDTLEGCNRLVCSLEGFEADEKQSSRLTVQADKVKNELYLADSTGQMTGLCIDMASWQIKAEIPGLCCFIPDTRQVVCRNFTQNCLVLYPVHSLEQLIEQGQELVNGSHIY